MVHADANFLPNCAGSPANAHSQCFMFISCIKHTWGDSQSGSSRDAPPGPPWCPPTGPSSWYWKRARNLPSCAGQPVVGVSWFVLTQTGHRLFDQVHSAHLVNPCTPAANHLGHPEPPNRQTQATHSRPAGGGPRPGPPANLVGSLQTGMQQTAQLPNQ